MSRPGERFLAAPTTPTASPARSNTMMKIRQTVEDAKEPRFAITVKGEVAIVDPHYMRPDCSEKFRNDNMFRFEGTGIWDVTVTPLEIVSDHRNGTMIATRQGTDPDAGEWEDSDVTLAVDSGLMSFFPMERGMLNDAEEFWGERTRQVGYDMTVLIGVNGALICESGIGSGEYALQVRHNKTGDVDGVKVDFTPSDAALSVLYEVQP